MKGFKILLILSATFFFQKSIAQIVSINQVYNKTKSAIFKIEILDKNDAVIKTGTGFFISSDGIGVSNFHVFTGASSARIRTFNGKIYDIIKVFSWDASKDLIKFQVKRPEIIFDEYGIPIKKSSEFKYLIREINPSQIGEKVVVIGNPKGLNNSISDGIISSFRHDEERGNIIQTSVPVSSGNSGSPLINLKGHYIGIISFSLKDAQNLNFAVSASELNTLTIIDALIFPPPPKTTDEPIEEPVKKESHDYNQANAEHQYACEYGLREIDIYKTLGKGKQITAYKNKSEYGDRVYSSISTSSKDGWLVTSALVVKNDNLAFALTIGINDKNNIDTKVYVQFSQISDGRPKKLVDGYYKFSPLHTPDNKRQDWIEIQLDDFLLRIFIGEKFYIRAFSTVYSNNEQTIYALDDYQIK